MGLKDALANRRTRQKNRQDMGYINRLRQRSSWFNRINQSQRGIDAQNAQNELEEIAEREGMTAKKLKEIARKEYFRIGF